MCDYNAESRRAAPEIHYSEWDETAVYHATEIRKLGPAAEDWRSTLHMAGDDGSMEMLLTTWMLCLRAGAAQLRHENTDSAGF